MLSPPQNTAIVVVLKRIINKNKAGPYREYVPSHILFFNKINQNRSHDRFFQLILDMTPPVFPPRRLHLQ